MTPTACSARVAVAPDKYARAVAPPGTVNTFDGVTGAFTYDWRCEPGSADNTARVRADWRVMPLAEALAPRYRTDAHMASYYLVAPDGQPLRRQPRIRKPGLAWVLSRGFSVEHDLIYVDVDNPLHAEWTPAMRARFEELWASSAVLATAGVYLTRAGYRLLQVLDEPVAASEAERYLASWIEELADAGIHVDTSCVDWTRLMRLPHVRRGPVPYTSPFVDLSRVVPKRIHPKAPAGPRGRRALTAESVAA